jgi:L-threonylcarbamoyladenylate synthase
VGPARAGGTRRGRRAARLSRVRAIAPSGERLEASDVEAICAVLTGGGLLLYPTDTLYALGGLVSSAEAARRVRAGKSRETGRALPAVAADVDQVRRLCRDVSEAAWALARAFWPGPLTLVLKAAPDLPVEVTAGLGTIAVRVPARALTRALCEVAGPLVSTSANVSGQPPAATCAEAVTAVGESAALAIDGGPGETRPSTIVDATGSSPRLVRAGAVDWEAVTRIWS